MGFLEMSLLVVLIIIVLIIMHLKQPELLNIPTRTKNKQTNKLKCHTGLLRREERFVNT